MADQEQAQEQEQAGDSDNEGNDQEAGPSNPDGASSNSHIESIPADTALFHETLVEYMKHGPYFNEGFLNKNHPDPNYHTYLINRLRRMYGQDNKPYGYYDPRGNPDGVKWYVKRIMAGERAVEIQPWQPDSSSSDEEVHADPSSVVTQPNTGIKRPARGSKLKGAKQSRERGEMLLFQESSSEEESEDDEEETEESDDAQEESSRGRRGRGRPARSSNRRTRRARTVAAQPVASTYNQPATPLAQHQAGQDADLLTHAILSPQEYQEALDDPQHVNHNRAAQDCYAGIGLFWIPVNSTESGTFDAARNSFDPLTHLPHHRMTGIPEHQARANAWAEIRFRTYGGGFGVPTYVVPHRGDVSKDGTAKVKDKTAYSSGLHDVSEDNLPPLMGQAFPREGFQPNLLKTPDGSWMLSMRPGGKLLRNFGNLVPNGISSEESACMLALYQACGAELNRDIKDRIHHSVELSDNNNAMRNAADKYRKETGNGGFYVANGNGGWRNKKSLNKVDQETLGRMEGDPEKMLHCVLWEVGGQGQYMRQPEPEKLKEKQDKRAPWNNYKGLWYPVPGAQEVAGRMKQLCDWKGIQDLPSLDDYLLLRPNATLAVAQDAEGEDADVEMEYPDQVPEGQGETDSELDAEGVTDDEM